MHYCRRDSHATSRTPIYANITQTGRISVYCSWFWVVLVGFVGFVGGFGWFWVVLLVVLDGFGWFWVVLGGFVGFVGGFGWFWVVLLVVLDGFGWFWVVLGGFGWFRVLVTTALPSWIAILT